MLDPERRQRPAHLRQLLLVHGPLRCRRVERPPGAVAVQRHGQPIGADHLVERGHHCARALALPELGIHHAVGRIVGDRDQRGALVRREREPGVPTAINVEQLAEAGARHPPPPMAAPHPLLRDQAGAL